MLILIDLILNLILIILVEGQISNFSLVSLILFSMAVKIFASIYSPFILLLLIPFMYVLPESSRIYFILLNIIYLITFFTFRYKSNKLDKAIQDLEKKESLISQQKSDEEKLSLYLETVKANTRLEERNDFSQRIHDMVGHSLSGALLQLELANKLIDKDVVQAKEMISDSSQIIRRGIDDIRKVLTDYKPEVRELGLAAVRNFLNNFTNETGIKTKLEFNGDLDKVSHLHWKTLQDNIIECSSNSNIHSKSKNFYVTIDVFNKLISMKVWDDGQSTKTYKKGMGISGMEERAAFLNGKILIDQSNGFKVTTILPIGED